MFCCGKVTDMENYYKEILDEIGGLLEKGEAEEASFLLKKELNMPYIPMDVEEKLKQYEKEVRYQLSMRHERGERSFGELLHMLKGKPQSQLAASAELSQRNLRGCIDEIADWLAKDPQPEAAALMIESLAMQDIDEEFVFVKNGVEYTFCSADIIPVAKQPVYLKASALLKAWFVHHPDYTEMSHTLLVHELYMFLPLMYEEEEALDVAKMIAMQLCDLMEDDRTKAELEELLQNGQKN